MQLALHGKISHFNRPFAETTSCGVAFHHAGLELADRRAVEEGFLSGNINIICSTSTLAVGVNLPCYLVIIKGTVSWAENGIQEYADLEMMQMLGRAGRPQFESSACAAILTRDDKVQRYEKMVSGKELLESSLHLNLIDHLNAEISLGTVFDIPSAKRWLGGTFLFVRLGRNPNHYQLDGNGSAQYRGEDELLEQICERDLTLLQNASLISSEGKLKCTESGEAMARYCIKFETMKIILSLPPKAKTSEIVSLSLILLDAEADSLQLTVLAQADEFHDIRMKAGEKALFKEMNKDIGIKFPIKVDIALPAHKISLLIQTELGGVEFPPTDAYKKYKQQYQQDKGIVFQQVNRLIRCIIDCQLQLQDSVSARHALELGRSLAARVWDSSPLQLKQLQHIGNISVRKLAGAGINSMEILENTEAHRIEAVLQKNPPFGMKLLSELADFPKLRVSVSQTGKEAKVGAHVEVNLKAVIGFLNERAPLSFRMKPIYVCFMAETSGGAIVDFRRMHAQRIQNEHEILIRANLSKPTAYITCHVMCDEVAGTSRSAEMKLDRIPTSLFPPIHVSRQEGMGVTNSSRSPMIGNFMTARQVMAAADDFGDGGLDDGDLLAAETLKGVEIMDIDTLFEEGDSAADTERPRTKSTDRSRRPTDQLQERTPDEPVRLRNGRWACNHGCKKENKACRHRCCNEGLDRPRKPPKKNVSQHSGDEYNTTNSASPKHQEHKNPFEAAHSVSEEKTHRQPKPGAEEARKPGGQNRHKAAEKNSVPKQSFSERQYDVSGLYKTEYLDDFEFEDLPMPSDLFGDRHSIPQLEHYLDEGDKIYPNAIGEDLGIEENELSNLQAGLVGFDNDFAVERSNLVILGDTHSSSETLDNFSSSKPQCSVTSNFFDVEEDMSFFETPLTHVELQNLRKRSSYTSDAMTLKPAEKDLAISEDSSSPFKAAPPRHEQNQKRMFSMTSVCEDELTFNTPVAKKWKSDVETTDVNEPTSTALADITNTHGRPQGTSSTMKEESRSEKERGVTEEGYEERQTRLWADIDQAFYEEFHDIVELVED